MHTKKLRLKRFLNYALVAFALALFSVLYLTGNTSRLITNAVTQASYAIILAVSLNLVVGCLGELSLGHAGFMCLGAFIGGLIYNALYASAPHLAAIIIAMLAGGLIAAIFGFLVGLPALRLKGDYLAIVTLAFGEIVRSVIKNQAIFGNAEGIGLKRYGDTLFIVALVAVLITLAVLQNFMKSKHGRAVTAIRDSEIAARSVGINCTFYKLLVFTLSAFFAGIAGVLYAVNTSVATYGAFSYNYSIEILVMVVLGGMGSFTGSIIAASAITLINVELTSLGGDYAAYKYLIYGVILVVFMILNSAPKLKPLRDKLNLRSLFRFIKKSISALYASAAKKRPTNGKNTYADNGGDENADITEAQNGVSWAVVPTKINNEDILLSVDFGDGEPDGLNAQNTPDDRKTDDKENGNV